LVLTEKRDYFETPGTKLCAQQGCASSIIISQTITVDVTNTGPIFLENGKVSGKYRHLDVVA
jgi:hypothetical protein